MKKPTYAFEQGILILDDPEIGLSHKSSWDPLPIPKERKRGEKSSLGHFLEVFTEGPLPYAYAWIKDRKFDGEYLLVYADGSIKGHQYYKHGLLHGPSKYYTASGHILSEAWYIEGLQEGRCTWYYETQKIYSKQFYRKGQWHGLQIFYYEDGTLKSELNYSNGRLHGTTRLFYPDGKLERLLEYEDGKVLKVKVHSIFDDA